MDGAAASLGVHVRRIYEVIKILEILSLINVSSCLSLLQFSLNQCYFILQFTGGKRGKFVWNGTKDFLFTIGRIQVATRVV